MRHLTWMLAVTAIAAAAATGLPWPRPRRLSAVKKKGVLVAGSSAEYPPFEFVADGKLIGYDVEMAEEITRRMGIKVEWEKLNFKGIVAALTAKRVDVLITALTYTPERAARIAFSEPYFDAGIGALIPKDSAVRKAEFHRQEGRRAARQLRRALCQRHLRVEGRPDHDLHSIVLAINDLRNGRVDAVVNPLPVLRYAVRNDASFRQTEVSIPASSGSIPGSRTRSSWPRSTSIFST